jgi:hypothetical protein
MTIRTAGRTLLSVITLAAFMVPVLTVAAKADDDHGRGRGHEWHERDEWREHEYYAHRWHRAHPVVVPGYVYAPPPVVYYPPEPEPGFNLIIPLHIH